MTIEAFGTPFIFIVFRYKSILCREDAYLLERVRYIHLNPIRAKWVSDIKALDKYAFSGHSVIMGKVKRHWQDYECVLGLFNDRLGVARRKYKAFVAKGYDLDKLASRVCELMHLEPAELWAPGKERKQVAARRLLCYWAARSFLHEILKK